VAPCPGASWTKTCVPGGVKGAALKLKLLNRATWAESLGWRQDPRRLRVNDA
jgi:hypothetical protein